MSVDEGNSELSGAGDALARLIRVAGRREQPPREAYERALQAATNTWRRKLRQRQYTWVSGLAAALLVVVALAWQALRPVTTSVQVAHFDRVIGSVQMRSSGADWADLTASSARLMSGSSIRTADESGAGLILDSGHSLRLAEATQLRVLASGRFELIAGKLYVATLDGPGHAIAVITAAGTATDVGTQFEVQYLDGQYRLRVREGAVMLQRASTSLRSTAREQLTIDADGTVRRSAVSPIDPQWHWVEALAPAVQVEGRPLTALLDWVARETGRAVRFADREAQQRAATTILHGNIGTLAPLEALTAMLATTDLRHRLLDDGTILIEIR
ncbi:MAG: FecR domain-containing protein [Steroidobacteraceae bacterium]